MTGRRTASSALLAVVLLLLTGCGIEPQSAPSDIPAELQADFGVSEAGGDDAAGTNRIYLLAPAAPDEPQRLRSVLRAVAGDPDPLLASLFSGPNEEEQAAGLSSVLPRELELVRETRTIGEVLYLDVSDDLEELTPEALRIAVAQIVATASGIDGISAVRLRVEGVEGDQLWPVGDGELTADTLTVYDYPGLIESTQPALPALPGGET